MIRSSIKETVVKFVKAPIYGIPVDNSVPSGYLFKASRPNLTADNFIIDDDTIINDNTLLVGYVLPSSGGHNYTNLISFLNETIWYTAGRPNVVQLGTVLNDSVTNVSTVIAGPSGKVIIYPIDTDLIKINKAKKWAGVTI